MNLKLPSEKSILSFLRTWYVIGILGFAIPFSYDIFRHLIPLNILLTTLIILVYHKPLNFRFGQITFLVFLLGYVVEVAGVKTGFLFGYYSYGSILGPKVAEVPLIMGMNWVLMIYGGVAIASRTGFRIFPASLLSALLVTASDIIIEKFAILTGMWEWTGGTPPLRNYLGWFVFSFILSVIYFNVVQSQLRRVALSIYIYQMVLFILTVVILTLVWQ